jgi:hypothetical protein
MVHHVVAERGGADFAQLGLVDEKVQIRTWLIAVALQVLLQGEQMIGQLVLETGRTG